MSQKQKDPIRTRQHVIPQWLQRGFSNNPNKRNAPIAVYCKNEKILLTGTHNVGVRKGFFTSDDFDADTRLTDLDGKFSEVANRLRSANGALTAEARQEACELVAHLEVRQQATENLIRTMWNASHRRVIQYLVKDNNAHAWLGRPEVPSAVELSKIHKNCIVRIDRLEGNGASSPINLRQMIETVVVNLAALKRAIGQELMNSTNPRGVLQMWLGSLTDPVLLDDAVRYNRSKKMLLGAEATSRVEGYSDFRWKVFQLQEDIVLGDSMVFHDVTDSRKGQNYLHNPWNQSTTYLPLSAKCLLTGSHLKNRKRLLTIPQIRTLAARASSELFIARVKKSSYERLIPLIGNYRPYASIEHWNIVTDECLRR